MKFGEVYDFRTAELAKKFIGKKGVFSDSLRDISEQPEDCDVFTLRETEEGVTYPYYGGHKGIFQFFRPLLEEEVERMSNRQLAEWLAKGYGEYTHEDGGITSLAFVYYKSEEDNPVSVTTLIRRWNDTEWVKPTKAIYEEDCLPDTIINKEEG